MIDLKAARAEPERFRTALARKGAADAFDHMLAADGRWRSLIPEIDELRSKQRIDGKPTPEQMGELTRIKAELKVLEDELVVAEAERDAWLAQVPNPPDDSAPDGSTDEDAEEVSRWGEPAAEGPEHTEVGRFELERAARLSGSRFGFLVGDTALVGLALYRFAIDRAAAHGHTVVVPPVLVREEAMYGTGFLPTDEAQLYVTTEDELYLVGTSEVPLAALHMTEILDEADLPMRYTGFSTCFRREAGTYGKDMGGMFRVHQFDKVEMFSFTTPERSWDEHDFLLSIEEEIVQNLELPYRVANIAAGDLGGSAAKKYDIEVWLPGQGKYRELTSCSNCTDYQARRLRTRVRRSEGKVEPLHTLNGTATAIGRTLIALMENHQQADGAILIPEVLWPYMAGVEKIAPA